MPQVTLVIGLPASGKSTYLEDFIRDGVPVFDDFMKGSSSDDFATCLHLQRIEGHLKAARDVVLADVRLTDPEFYGAVVSRLHSITPELRIRNVCFENNRDQCLANSAHRANQQLENHLREQDLIARFSTRYSITPGAEIIPVRSRKR
jgi:hypothetical protein